MSVDVHQRLWPEPLWAALAERDGTERVLIALSLPLGVQALHLSALRPRRRSER